MFGNITQSATPWKDFAAAIAERFGKSDSNADDVLHVDKCYCLQGNGIDRADTAGCNGKGWREDKAYTLNTIDRHAVYDARGNGSGQIVPTITGDHENRVTDYTAVCVRERCGCDGGGKGLLIQEDKSGTLAVSNDQFVMCVGNGQANSTMLSDKAACLNCMHDQQAIIALDRAAYNQGKNAMYNFEVTENGINSTLTAKGPGAILRGGGDMVRRLTPLENERLQGFPDNWTDIGEYIDSKGKKRTSSDSARYKALGNSIALPFWAWMLERLMPYCDDNKTMASLFDGIGGFPLIWETLGGKCLWASEIEEFCIAVTKAHFGDDT